MKIDFPRWSVRREYDFDVVWCFRELVVFIVMYLSANCYSTRLQTLKVQHFWLRSLVFLPIQRILEPLELRLCHSSQSIIFDSLLDPISPMPPPRVSAGQNWVARRAPREIGGLDSLRFPPFSSILLHWQKCDSVDKNHFLHFPPFSSIFLHSPPFSFIFLHRLPAVFLAQIICVGRSGFRFQ